MNYYFCNYCMEEIPVEEILYDAEMDDDICPLCQSNDVDYIQVEE